MRRAESERIYGSFDLVPGRQWAVAALIALAVGCGQPEPVEVLPPPFDAHRYYEDLCEAKAEANATPPRVKLVRVALERVDRPPGEGLGVVLTPGRARVLGAHVKGWPDSEALSSHLKAHLPYMEGQVSWTLTIEPAVSAAEVVAALDAIGAAGAPSVFLLAQRAHHPPWPEPPDPVSWAWMELQREATSGPGLEKEMLGAMQRAAVGCPAVGQAVMENAQNTRDDAEYCRELSWRMTAAFAECPAWDPRPSLTLSLPNKAFLTGWTVKYEDSASRVDAADGEKWAGLHERLLASPSWPSTRSE